MKVIIESLTRSDINTFLLSDEVLEIANRGDSSRSICMKILASCASEVNDSSIRLPQMKSVSIYKVNQDDTIDILSSNHIVLKYDGYFYDYYPQEFQDSFQDDISENVPVIQRVITNKDSLTRFDSNIKGYSIVEGSDN